MNWRRRRVLQTDGVALAKELYASPFEPWDREVVRTLVMCAVASVWTREEAGPPRRPASRMAIMKVVCALHQAVQNAEILDLREETSDTEMEVELRRLAALEIFKHAKGLESAVGESVRHIFGVP